MHMTDEKPKGKGHTEIVLVAPNYWGKGLTFDEAAAQLRRVGGSLANGYHQLTFPPELEFLGVDMMGRMTWTGDTENFKPVEVEVPADTELQVSYVTIRLLHRRDDRDLGNLDVLDLDDVLTILGDRSDDTSLGDVDTSWTEAIPNDKIEDVVESFGYDVTEVEFVRTEVDA